MELPNAQRARVEQAKVLDYLLATDHPEGGSKAEFFSRFGFSIDQWQHLADALRVHGTSHEVAEIEQTPFGMKYSVDGIVETPDGRAPRIRTVWIVDKGADDTRLVTAYPLRR